MLSPGSGPGLAEEFGQLAGELEDWESLGCVQGHGLEEDEGAGAGNVTEPMAQSRAHVSCERSVTWDPTGCPSCAAPRQEGCACLFVSH